MNDLHGVGAHYDQVTSAWEYLLGADLHYGYFDEPGESLTVATARLTDRMAEAAQLDASLRVLDVGCGIGTPAMTLAERFGCRVTGITISEVGLNRACATAAARGLDDRVDFRWGDGMDNGEPDASYHRAWVMESSHLMDSKAALISEVARVLRPGGRVVLCDIIAHSPFNISEIMKHGRALQLLDRVFGRARMETFAEYERLAVQAGMHVTTTEDMTAATLPTFAAWRANADEHRAVVAELIGVDALDEFVESSRLLEDLWSAGKLGYGLVVADKP